MRFEKGDSILILNNMSITGKGMYLPTVYVGRVVQISLVVDGGYEFLDEKGLPWFVYKEHTCKPTKLHKALA